MPDVEEFLHKWFEVKLHLAKLEAKCAKYKRMAERLMDKKGKNTLISKSYILNRRSNTRQSVSKANLPVEIWNRYSTRNTYNSYHLKKN